MNGTLLISGTGAGVYIATQPPGSGTDVICPTLNDPENGVVMMGEFGLGAIATYSCNTGYRLDGPDMITCDENNEWTPSPPTCTLVQCPPLISPTNGGVECPPLIDPDNGNVKLSGDTFGQTAEYTCNNGFDLVGESMLMCGADGLWIGNPPVCNAVQCPTLDKSHEWDSANIWNWCWCLVP
jgi:CUB/sushi domain-containing protein